MNTESRQRVIEWDTHLDKLSYEEILGVPPNSSADKCREAYYQFARAFHPDVHPHADPNLREALTRVFQRGVEAYRVLTHPHLRTRWASEKRNGRCRLADLTVSPEIDLTQELSGLHVHCRSAGAKLTAQQAAVSYARGNVAQALDLLKGALDYEGGANTYLARCLDALSNAGHDQ